MKTIDLKKACEFLEDCSTVIADENLLSYPAVKDLTGDPENIFLEIGWTDGDDETQTLRFREGDNAEVRVSGASFFLREREADEVQVSLLCPWVVE